LAAFGFMQAGAWPLAIVQLVFAANTLINCRRSIKRADAANAKPTIEIAAVPR